VNGLSASFDAYGALREMSDTLAADETKAAQDAKLVAAAKDFEKKAAALMSGSTGFGIANRDLARRLQDLDFGDMRPTASDMTAIDQSCREIEESEKDFHQLRQQDLPALNQMLRAAHLPEMTTPADPPVGGCGVP
jgi:hypothetical protein